VITIVFVITQDGERSAKVVNPVFPHESTSLEDDLARRVSIAGAQALHAVMGKGGSFNFSASGNAEQAGQVSDAVRRFGQEGS
jgi:hypothetical protein